MHLDQVYGEDFLRRRTPTPVVHAIYLSLQEYHASFANFTISLLSMFVSFSTFESALSLLYYHCFPLQLASHFNISNVNSGGSRISQTEGRTPGFGSVTSQRQLSILRNRITRPQAMFVHTQNLVALDSNEPRYNSRWGSASRCPPP